MNHPIYKNLNRFECSRCEKIVDGDNYSMLWEGNPYCAKCALKMKASGEVIDKELPGVFYEKRKCEVCGRNIDVGPEEMTKCVECRKTRREVKL